MTEWKEIPFGNLAAFRNGLNFSNKSHGTGCKMIGVGDFGDKRIPDYDTLEQINPEGIVRGDDYLIEGDIIFVRSNGNKNLVGRSLFIDRKDSKVVFSGFCIRARIYSELAVPLFYAYFFRTSTFRKMISNSSGGTNIQNLNQGLLSNALVPLPSLAIQKQITSILSAYDDLIENNLKRIKLLEELAQRTYEEWFVMFRINGEALEMDEETGLPVGWNELCIGNLIKFQKGKKPNGISSEYKEGFEKMLLLEGIESGKYSFADPNGQVFAKRGDLLMLMDGARSSKVFFADDGVVGSTISRISIIEERLSATLLKHFFESNFELMQTNNTGAAIPHANKNFINSMMFRMPSIAILNKWNNLIGSAYKQIQTLKDQIYRLKETRDILLPRLMNGTISITIAKTIPATKIIQFEAPTQKQAAPQFKEAILISLLTLKFGSEKYPLGRMRYTKLSYLFHRHADNQIKDYLRKAAGPYNPKTKYGGAEKIAHDKGYVIDCKNGQLTGFITGPNIEDARPYFEKYWHIEYLTWLEEQFKYKSNDELELFATVDNSLIELNEKNEPFTVEAVKNILKKESEWTAKLEREIFSDANIQRAISYLPTIFQY